MNVEVACPQCGTQYAVREELLGRRSKCAKCGRAFALSAPQERPETTASAKVETPPVVARAEGGERPEFNALPQIDVAPPIVRTQATPPMPPPTPAAAGIAAPSFWALRWMARSYEVLAILALIGILVPITLLIHTVANYPTLATLALLQYGLAILWQIVCAAVFLLVAQLIRLVLQVEQNTRETSAACRRLAEHLCAIESAE